MGYHNAATRRKIAIYRTGAICFRKMDLVTCNIGNDFSITLSRRFAGGVNVHFKMPYTAVVIKLDHRVTYAHTRKAINFIAGYRITLPAYALD